MPSVYLEGVFVKRRSLNRLDRKIWKQVDLRPALLDLFKGTCLSEEEQKNLAGEIQAQIHDHFASNRIIRDMQKLYREVEAFEEWLEERKERTDREIKNIIRTFKSLRLS
jgi:hypothetical protein